MSRDEYRALTPWSFFLPMALAVALGVLAANGLGALLFDGGRADQASAASPGDARPADAATGSAQAPKEKDRSAAAQPVAPGPEVAATATDAPSAAEPERLPGPSSARRDGAERACIGGTVAVRAANGWEQEVVDDAPARCVAYSN